MKVIIYHITYSDGYKATLTSPLAFLDRRTIRMFQEQNKSGWYKITKLEMEYVEK